VFPKLFAYGEIAGKCSQSAGTAAPKDRTTYQGVGAPHVLCPNSHRLPDQPPPRLPRDLSQRALKIVENVTEEGKPL
jgi:hypothetical protein